MSTSLAATPVYIVHIIDIAMLYDINGIDIIEKKITMTSMLSRFHCDVDDVNSSRGTEHEKGNNYIRDDEEVKCHNPFISKSY